MKISSKFWSVLFRSTFTLTAVLLAFAGPSANAQLISPGLWHANSASVSVTEGDQSRGTPKADLNIVNAQIAVDRRDDSQSPVFTLTSGSEFFNVRTSGENPVLSLKPNADLDYEKHQSILTQICATVAGQNPGTTAQECYSITINVRPRDEAPVLHTTFGPGNVLYLTATDALPRYNLLNHFADPERQNITGQLVGQTTVSSLDGYTVTATLTADVLLSFTKRLPPGGTLSSARVHVYKFRVQTQDAIGNTSETVEFTMYIRLGANTPPVFIGGVTSAVWTVDENFAGDFTQTVEARDVDAGDAITYSMEGQDSAGQLLLGGACLSIDSATAVVTIGCNGATFDRETSATNIFKIIASDRFGGTVSVNVTVNVNDINEPPQARNFDRTPPFNMYLGATRQLNLPYHFFDPEGTSLTFVVVALSSNASITPQGDNRTITAVHEGSTRINVVATDGTGLVTSHSIDVKVKAQGQNTAPYFNNAIAGFRYTLSEDARENTRIGSPHPATDSDNDSLYYRILGHADRFSVQQNNGQIYVNRNNAFDFERDQALTFTLEVSDHFGGRDTITVTVELEDVNEPPVKVSDIPAQTVAERASIQVTIARYFNDPDTADRGNLRYDVRVHDPAFVAASVSNGILTINGLAPGDTSITVSAVDRGSFSVSSTFTVRVNQNIPPRLQNPIPDQVIAPNTPTVIDLTNVFVDIHNLTISDPESSDPSVALATLVGADGTRIVLVGHNRGTTTITLTATSESGETISHSFRVTVNSIPEVISPIQDHVVNTGSSTTVDLALVFNDPDVGDTLRYEASVGNQRIARANVNGTFLVLTGLRAGSTTVSVVATDNSGASVTDTFTFRVNSSPTLVNPIGPVTLANSEASQVIELENVFQDPDPNDNLTYSATSSNTSAATVSVTGNILLVRAVKSGAGSIMVTATDSHGEAVSTTFNFFVNAVPMLTTVIDDLVLPSPTASELLNLANHFEDADMENLSFSAQSADTSIATVAVRGSGLTIRGVAAGNTSITVTAADNLGQEASSSFMVRVNAVPMVSMAIDDIILMDPTASAEIDLSQSFEDADEIDMLTFTAMSRNDAIATVDVDGSTLTVQAVSSGTTTVTVTATDDLGALTADTFSVRVNAVPMVSMEIDDIILMDSNASMEIDLSQSFEDADTSDTLTFTAMSDDESIATVSVDGSTVTVQGVSPGTTSITVTATDDFDVTATDTFMVRVNAVPMVSMEIDDIILMNPSASLDIDVSGNFEDADEMDTLTFKAMSDDETIATVSVDGSTVTVQGVSPGTTSITVTATDDFDVTATDTFMVRVNAVPMVSMEIDDIILMNPSASLDIDVSGNFEDADEMDTLTFKAMSDDEAIATVSVDGSTIRVQGMSPGTTSVTITATDDLGAYAMDTFMVRVNAVPMVVLAIDDMNLVTPADSLTVDLSIHFADADEEDTLVFTAESSAIDAATVSIDGTMLTVQGVAPGDTEVSVTATDDQGAYAMDMFMVHVNAVPMVSMELEDIILQTPESSMDFDLNMYFSDADMEALTYSAESGDTGIAMAMVSGSMLTVQGVTPGNTMITVTAMDALGAYVMDTFMVRVNAVPMVANPLADVTVTVGTPLTVDLSSTFTDADAGDTLTLTAESSNTSLATVAVNGSASTLTITGLLPGTLDATVIATDDQGASASDSFTVTVKTIPMVATTLPSVTLEVGGEPHVSDVSTGFSDADGDVLSYGVSLSADGIASSSLSGSSLTLVAIDQGMTEATITATDPDGNSVSQTFAISVNQDALFTAANKSLSAFGRAMLGSVSNAIGSRVTSADDETGEEYSSQVLSQLAQSQNTGYGIGANDLHRDIFDIGTRRGSGLAGHSLTNTLNPTAFSPRRFAMSLAGTGIGIWGAADVTNYEGAEYEGSASFFHLGADVGINSDWLVGLAITQGGASNDFAYGTAEREMDINITAFSPYARYTPSEQTSIWAAGTIGNGEVEVSGGPSTTANDLSANMFLLGGRQSVRELGYVSLAVRADAAFATLSTDGEDDLSANLDASVNRIRAVVEASFDAGNGMEPFVDLGFRNDGGDGDSGSGVELAGGILIQSEAVNVEARAHTLVSHGADDYSESGVSVVARLDLGGAQGTGFAAELAPRWGNEYGNSGLIGNLYDSSRLSSPIGYRTGESMAISSRLQYGVAVSNDQFLITPFVDYDDQSSNRYQVLIGAELHSLLRDTSKLNVSAAVGHSRVSTGKSGPIFGLNANLRFK